MEIIKDLFVSFLIIVCILLVISVIFYDKVPFGKVIPQSEEYQLSAQMEQSLKDSGLSDKQEIVVNYYIDAKDLNKYEKANEYVKGKSNPFVEVSTLDTNQNTVNNSSSTNGTGNFYDDDGTK